MDLSKAVNRLPYELLIAKLHTYRLVKKLSFFFIIKKKFAKKKKKKEKKRKREIKDVYSDFQFYYRKNLIFPS